MSSPVAPGRLFKPASIVIALLLSGCAAIHDPGIPIIPDLPSIAVATAVLPDPRGVVVVEKISCRRADVPPDAADYFRQEIENALREHDLGPRTGDSGRIVYRLSANIERAGRDRTGRYLAPSGPLVDLVVLGVLRQAPGSLPACDISLRRSIYPQTSGTESFRSTLADMAKDIAEELKVRLRGGGHIVQLHSIVDLKAEERVDIVPLKIRFYPLQDGRREKRRLGYTVPYPGYLREPLVADRRQVRDYFFETIRESLCGLGHDVVEDGEDVTVSGVLRLFWLWAEPENRHWDVFAEVEFVLELVDRKTGRSKSIPIVVRTKDRVYVPPSPAVFEMVAGEAVSELLNQVAANLVPINLPR